MLEMLRASLNFVKLIDYSMVTIKMEDLSSQNKIKKKR